MTTRKEDILGLLEDLNRDLKLYEDPIYTPKEKEDIQRFGKFTLELFNDLKNDKYLSMDISKSERERGKRIAKFSKTPIDISNKLLKTKNLTLVNNGTS